MIEKVNKTLISAEIKKLKELEDAEWAAAYLVMYPEPLIVLPGFRECEPEVAELEKMMTLFEALHSLSELHAITNLRRDQALKHPTREPARVALIPIVALLNILPEETNISREKYQELKEKYRRLSRAVGMINKNKVDHKR